MGLIVGKQKVKFRDLETFRIYHGSLIAFFRVIRDRENRARGVDDMKWLFSSFVTIAMAAL